MRAAFRTLSLLLLTFGACSFEPAGLDHLSNECDSDADCGAAVCDLERRMCVTPTASEVRLGFLVTAPSDVAGGSPTQLTFPPIDVAEGGELGRPLELPAPMTVVGDVAVAAELRFERQSAFPGGPTTRFVTTTSPTPSRAADGEPADYRLQVSSGSTYSVHVQPTGEAAFEWPPLRVSSVTVPGCEGACAAGPAMWRLDVPYPDELERFAGSIVSSSEDGREVPEEGLRVRAVDPESGRVVSSTGMTDAQGNFDLRLSPGVGPYLLRITAGEDRALFPTLTVDPGFLFPGEERPRILVPRLEPVHYVGFVEEEAMDAARVPGAVLTFRSNDVFDDRTRVAGSYRMTAVSETQEGTEPGRFEVTLLPGTYEVVVEPAGQPELGVAVETVRIARPVGGGDTLRGQVFEVPPRARAGGRVVVAEAEGEAEGVEGVVVQARARPWARGVALPAAAAYNRDSDALTDATGRFDLRLDVGVYDLLVKPPPESGFPWSVRPDLTIGSTEGAVAETFELDPPVPLSGTVRSPTGAPSAGAELQVYAIIESEGGGVRALPVGEARTDGEGRFRLMLPPRL
jgi:hypothetical protein